MEEGIKLKVLNIENEEVKYKISISNGDIFSSLEIYGYNDSFLSFAQNLIQFPFGEDREVVLKIGDDIENWACYFQLKVFCYEDNGATAIEVKMHNKLKIPDLIQAHFYINTLPNDINNLGKELASWDITNYTEFVWIPSSKY